MSKKQFPSTRSEWFVVNYMEIQDFVELPCISLLRYTWNDTENVLENCETILEKVLEKCLNFFLKTCTHHESALVTSTPEPCWYKDDLSRYGIPILKIRRSYLQNGDSYAVKIRDGTG